MSFVRQMIVSPYTYCKHCEIQNFQIKVFCSDKSLPTSLRFYQGVILFRDVIPGSLVLQAQRGDDWDMYQDKEKAKVLAQITLQSRRPAHTIANLVPPIPGRNAIFERQATETDYWADNFQTDYDEISGGIASPLGSNKAVLQVSFFQKIAIIIIYPNSCYEGWLMAIVSLSAFDNTP